MTFLLALILLFSPLAALADQQLHATVCHDCDFALRWNPEADTLELSNQDTWAPWMPEGSFGWQILDESQLRGMFYCPNDFVRSIDFDQKMVLAVVRYDSVKWHFFPRSISFSPTDAHMTIQYEAATRTLLRKRKHVSAAIFLIDISEKLRQSGITNLTYTVIESQRGPWKASESPVPAPSAEVWFPVAYTRQDLARSLAYRQQLLASLEPASEASNWLPDYFILDGIQLQPHQTLPPTTYMMIDDSLRWSRTFLPMTGRNRNEHLTLTSQDFDRFFAIVVIRRDAGWKVDLDEMYWAEQGLRINIAMREVPRRPGPSVFVMFLPRGDYGILSFRENGGMIDPDSLR